MTDIMKAALHDLINGDMPDQDDNAMLQRHHEW